MPRRGAVQEVQRGLLGREFRVLCLRIGRREEKGSVGRIQCWAVPVVRYHRSGACREGRETADAEGYVERVGHPHAFGGSSLVQSVQLSDRGSVAARQLTDRAGYAALRVCRRGSGGGS